MIIAAKTILTLVLCWPRKAHVFCLKNIAVCPVCNHLVFIMLEKDFLHAFGRNVWIKVLFFWCFLEFVVAN